MKHPILAPNVGESITEVSILKWRKANGEAVNKGEVILEIESDKATVEIIAEASGALGITKAQGERVPVGETIGFVDDSVQGTASAKAPAPPMGAPKSSSQASSPSSTFSPAVRKIVAETGIPTAGITGTGKGGRLTKGDVLGFPSTASAPSSPSAPSAPSASGVAAPAPKRALAAGERREPMSRIRQKIAERLVYAQHTAAILTTFNECDMSAVMALRAKHKDAFKAKNGVPLSFMSFFTRAAVEALKLQPTVNASIDGTDVIYRDGIDMGIAVGTDRGLVVPVIRQAHQMGFVEIEKTLGELAVKARDSKLSIADMSGGSFTISNGGTYGSLLSTPILNPPQSAILGMHKIQERPIALNGKIEIRPMMYLALSYDHRLIDGKEAVTFLVAIKDFIENPAKLNPGLSS